MRRQARPKLTRGWETRGLILLLLALAGAARSIAAPPLPEAAATAAGRADQRLVSAIRRHAQPLTDSAADYDTLIESLQGKRFVLLGEDTHGTEEIYRERARITQRLIENLDFDGLIIESDFTPVERLNRYVQAVSQDRSAAQALTDHQRFPNWMWRNRPFAQLIETLREYRQTSGQPVQVFGMDLHGMEAAAAAVKHHLGGPSKLETPSLRAGLACLAAYDFAAERYRAALMEQGMAASCAPAMAAANDALTQALAEMQPNLSADQRFSLRRNWAQLQAAEAYARVQVDGSENAWNQRDRFLAETVSAIADWVEFQRGRPARLVVWAHNTHLADARATDRGRRSGYLSLGQLLRERYPEQTYIVGFSTRLGTVRAAPDWGEPDRVYRLRRPAWESVSALLGRVKRANFILKLDPQTAPLAPLDENLPMRAIGVVYWPQAERREHYFRGDLRGMFDAIVHLDHSQAIERLP